MKAHFSTRYAEADASDVGRLVQQPAGVPDGSSCALLCVSIHSINVDLLRDRKETCAGCSQAEMVNRAVTRIPHAEI